MLPVKSVASVPVLWRPRGNCPCWSPINPGLIWTVPGKCCNVCPLTMSFAHFESSTVSVLHRATCEIKLFRGGGGEPSKFHLQLLPGSKEEVFIDEISSEMISSLRLWNWETHAKLRISSRWRTLAKLSWKLKLTGNLHVIQNFMSCFYLQLPLETLFAWVNI
jgi:hypothetical protein